MKGSTLETSSSELDIFHLQSVELLGMTAWEAKENLGRQLHHKITTVYLLDRGLWSSMGSRNLLTVASLCFRFRNGISKRFDDFLNV